MGLRDRTPLRTLPTQAQLLDRAFCNRWGDTREISSTRSSQIVVTARSHPLSFQKKAALQQARADMINKLATPAERAAFGYATKLLRTVFDKYRRGWGSIEVTRRICDVGQIKMYGEQIETFAQLIAVQAQKLVGEDFVTVVHSWGTNITFRLIYFQEPLFVLEDENLFDIRLISRSHQ